MARIVDKDARRAEFISAAAQVFAKRGVANTTVSNIARAAKVAQGTLYLYFNDKDDIVAAVVEDMADRMAGGIESALAADDRTAVDQLLALRDLLTDTSTTPGVTELIEITHCPENRAMHDRMAERLMPRLAAVVEAIVEQGIAEGAFTVTATREAAWFVLGGLRSVELSGTSPSEMPAALAMATDLALRALGYEEPVK